MLAKQLTVFIENRTGRLDDVLESLKEAGINIISLSLADSSEYGLLRMIVSEPEKAKEYLNVACEKGGDTKFRKFARIVRNFI